MEGESSDDGGLKHITALRARPPRRRVGAAGAGASAATLGRGGWCSSDDSSSDGDEPFAVPAPATAVPTPAARPAPAVASSSSPPSPQFSVNTIVNYARPGDAGSYQAAVVAVDVTVTPPSYTIRFSDNSERVTEEAYLSAYVDPATLQPPASSHHHHDPHTSSTPAAPAEAPAPPAVADAGLLSNASVATGVEGGDPGAASPSKARKEKKDKKDKKEKKKERRRRGEEEDGGGGESDEGGVAAAVPTGPPGVAPSSSFAVPTPPPACVIGSDQAGGGEDGGEGAEAEAGKKLPTLACLKNPHPSAARVLPGTKLYATYVVDKISGRGFRCKRLVIVTSLYVLFAKEDGEVRKFFKILEIQKAFLQDAAGGRRGLLQLGERSGEPDVLFATREKQDVRNSHGDITDVIRVVQSIQKVRLAAEKRGGQCLAVYRLNSDVELKSLMRKTPKDGGGEKARLPARPGSPGGGGSAGGGVSLGNLSAVHCADTGVDSDPEGVVGSTPAPKWKPDSAASKCEDCAKAFTVIRRKHHCRACGGVFCNACTGERAVVKKLGVLVLHRNVHLRKEVAPSSLTTFTQHIQLGSEAVRVCDACKVRIHEAIDR